MKTTTTVWGLLLLCLAVAMTTGCASTGSQSWQDIPIPELNAWETPDYEKVELDNGMVLYLAEDHDLPLVELSATIQVGSLYDPANQLGLAAMTGSVLRTGGAGERTGDEIDALVEAAGMQVETWAGRSTGGAYLSCLTEDTDTGLGLLADILMRPRFAPEKIELARQEQKSSISRRNDEPMPIAMREAPKVLYGADHPLARHPEYDTIAAVGREDMQAFHAAYFGPDRARLVVIGDFETDDMVARIERAFAGWQPAGAPLPPDPEVPWRDRTVNVAPKDGLSQAIVLLGHRGIRNDHDDYAAVRVAAEILGGGFSSRLFKEIRSNQGLAYAVGATPGTGWRFPGTFMAFTMTKNSTVEAAADAIMAEIEGMLAEPVTAEELQFAKDAILNSEVFDYDTTREVLDRVVTLELYGYAPDFLAEYQEAVQQLTPEAVHAAVLRNWKPEDLSFLVVGTPDEFDGDFGKYGEVREIDITIPAPTPTLDIPAATDESLARGRELMRTLRAKTGGDRYDALESYREVNAMTVEMPQGEFAITLESLVDLPDRMRMVTKMPFGEQVVVVSGDRGWSSAMGQTEDLPAAQVADMRADLLTDTKVLLGDLEAHDFQALEPLTIAERNCDPVAVELNGETSIFFLDAETGLLVMSQQPGTSPMTGSPVTEKRYVEAYATMDGLKIPAEVRVTHDDADFARVEVVAFELNPVVDASLFEK